LQRLDGADVRGVPVKARVLFTLTMPGRSTWNGKWSGDERRHIRIRELDPLHYEQLLVGIASGNDSWSYHWSDGWAANVAARILDAVEQVPRGDGFCGYDWMIDSIIRYGKIYADHEIPKAATP
jgi:hypothetical protein